MRACVCVHVSNKSHLSDLVHQFFHTTFLICNSNITELGTEFEGPVRTVLSLFFKFLTFSVFSILFAALYSFLSWI